MSLQQPPSSAQSEPNRALRLTFSYEGNNVRLVSRQSVEMKIAPSDRTDEYEGHSGFWFELKDANNRTLYRRVMSNPIKTHLEAPSGDPQRPFTHVKADKLKGTFVILAPALEGAATLLIFASPPEAAARSAKEIARIDLKQPDRRPNPPRKEKK